MKKILFWRLFVALALGGVIFFSLLHSVAILSSEKMSYLKRTHQQEILDWGNQAQTLLENGDRNELNDWLNALAEKEDTWVTLVESNIKVIGGNELTERFWSGYGIGRSVEWKIHLDFPNNPIMEVALTPSNYHFLIILPDRMRPGTYMSHAFWTFRVVIPFISLLTLTIFIYRYVMKPMRGFSLAAKEFSQGNYQARVTDHITLGNDELSQVAKTFDKMAERTADVIQHNRNLIAEMSHEIRTPLARIEMAADCAANGLDKESMIDRIRIEVSNMRQMAEDTLTLAWLENEQPNLCTESFDLTELLEAIIDDAQFEFPDRIIISELPESLLLTSSNQRALSQAFENIIRNGLRFTPRNEALAISARKQENTWVITISDSGPGLDPTLTESIFKPFFKADNQTHSRKGFGVGLALAKRHIEAIKGSISASNRKYQGLDMIITLPQPKN